MSPKKTKKRDKKRKPEELSIFDDYSPKRDYEDEEVLQMNGP